MTTHEILNNGFQKATALPSNEYTNGIVKVLVDADHVVGVFVTNVKVNSIKKIEELVYLCKRVNVRA